MFVEFNVLVVYFFSLLAIVNFHMVVNATDSLILKEIVDVLLGLVLLFVLLQIKLFQFVLDFV